VQDALRGAGNVAAGFGARLLGAGGARA